MVRPRDDGERDVDRHRRRADLRADRPRHVLRRRDRRPAGVPPDERDGGRRERRHRRRDPADPRDRRDRALAALRPRLPGRAVRRARSDCAPLAAPRPGRARGDEARARDRDQRRDPARLVARGRSDRGPPRRDDRGDERPVAERRVVRGLRAARRASRPRAGAAPRCDRARPLLLRAAHRSPLRRTGSADPDDRADRVHHELPRCAVPGRLPGVRHGGVRQRRLPRRHARSLRRRGAARLARVQRRRASAAAPTDVRVLVPARGTAVPGALAAAVAPGHARPDGRVGARLGAAEPGVADRRLRADTGAHARSRPGRHDRRGVPRDPRGRGARRAGRRVLRRCGDAVRDRRLLPRRDAHRRLQPDAPADGSRARSL